MDIAEIRKLVELMEEKGVVELEVENRKGKVRLLREDRRAPTMRAESLVATPATAVPAAPVAPRQDEADGGAAEWPGGKVVTSPMVGTFYRAGAPEADPYANVGDVVERGAVLCVIEAMKIMNEIEAEFRGRVLEVLAENGQAVEFEQPLFVLEPLYG